MASTPSIYQRSIFMGNPIVVSVTSIQTPANAAFHRVKLYVTVLDSSNRQTEYVLSHPVKNATSSGEDILFDISSSLRSFAESDTYAYSPISENKEYNYFIAKVSATDVYVVNSVLVETTKSASLELTAYRGKFSDYERRHNAQTLSFSRKPTTSPEIMFYDDYAVIGIVYNGSRPLSKVKHLIDYSSGSDIIHVTGTTITDHDNGTKIYVAPARSGSYLFQFVNSRGVIETIRLFSKETEKMNGEVSDSVISRFETFSSFSRNATMKYAQQSELTLSSGYVDLAWARWFAAEFAQAEQYWIKIEDIFVPCAVTIDESTTVIDRTKTGLLHVDFTVKPNMSGSYF